MTTDRPLPAAARGLIIIVSATGAAVLAVHAPGVVTWGLPEIATWSILVLAMVVTEQFPMSLRHHGEGETFALTDAIWVAALILARADVLILAAAAGALTGQLIQRVPLEKVAFNLGQYMVGLGLAVLAYRAFDTGSVTEPRTWLAAMGAMAFFFVVNEAAVAAVISLVTGKRLRDVALPSLPFSVLHWAGNVAIGVLGALLWVTTPAGLILLLTPLLLSYLAYAGWLRSMREGDQMREMARTADAITEQKDLTRRLPRIEGGDAVAQLTATLNDMLDRLERAFLRERRFLSEASHELRTPITVCRANLEILSLQADQQEARTTVVRVVDELTRMTRIVEDMTTLARMEHPRFLRPEMVDLAALVDDVTAKVQPLLGKRLRTGVSPTGALVEADPQRLTQAVLNLLQNAQLHAHKDSPIRLEVCRDGGSWRIEVGDEGGGLPPGMEEELFEPFRRGAGRRPGSGLGLAVVRSVAEAHGGAAGVENRPGEGATFWITVPA